MDIPMGSVGKQKKVTPLNAWALSFACMIGWAAFVMPATVFLPTGGIVGSLLAFLLAAFAMGVVALNYHFLGNLYPDSGGIYPLVHRSLNRYHAFAAAWAMGLAHQCCVSLNARALGMLIRTILEEAFNWRFDVRIFGGSYYLLDACVVLIALVFFGFINVRGLKQTVRIQTAGAIVLLGGIVAMLAGAFFTSETPSASFTPAYAPGVSPFFGFTYIFILTPWAYVGFDSLSKLTSDLDFSVKRLGKIMLISVLCGTFAYVANIFTALLGMPSEYGSWPEYLAYLHTFSGIDGYPVALAAQDAFGSFGIVIFFAAAIAATLTGLVGFFLSISRLVYQMAEDEALPTFLRRVHPTRGTPVNAIWTVVVLSLVLLALLNTFDAIEELASVATSVGYGYVSLCALRKALEKRSRLYIATGLMGVLFCAFWIFFLLVPVPQVSASISAEGKIFLVIWIFAGITAYAFSRRKKRPFPTIDSQEV